jgi:predicted membrane protein
MNQRGQLPVRWIVALGILLVLVLATIAAGWVIGSVLSSVANREGDFSFRTEQPASIDELQDSYELGTGSLEVNLSELDLPEATTEVEARVGDGALTVVVPEEAVVRADAEAENGLVALFGRNVTGEDVKQDFEDEGYNQAERRLSLNLSMGTGVITVLREE